MEKSQLKTIQLSYDQLNMVYTMIRSAELRMNKPKEEHFSLDRKVQAAKRTARPGYYYLMNLDPEECKLIRTYNTDYCAVLANQDDEGEIQGAEIIEIYLLATNIQMTFTSRY